MSSLLLFGFLIGMRHALEVDHVSAVAALATGNKSMGETVRHGVVWGLGHTTTLFVVGAIVIALDQVVPERIAHVLEMMVGGMLVLLGLDVLRRFCKERVHFHIHTHDDGTRHFHAHGHTEEEKKEHIPEEHQHNHKKAFPLRALFVGMMHGLAGSAALVLLTLESIRSPWVGMMYMALFGVGSMMGMGILSAAIAVPLHASARAMTWAHNGLQIIIGVVTIGLGIGILLTG